jgi:demethylmenaquinone methyltransferase/2-methoxy-6-polyprenyl-1,4-benzoquinol methylase
MAEKWDEITDHDDNIIKNVIETLPDLSQPSILDIGAGTGVMVPFLKERYGEKAKITEIDFAEEMIQVSRKKHKAYKNIEFVVGDIYDYPLPEAGYDLIVCFSVFPHFPDKELILERCKKLLKNKGVLLIFHSQSRSEINRMHKKAGKEVSSDRLPPAGQVVVQAVGLDYSLNKSIDNSQLYLLQFVKDDETSD